MRLTDVHILNDGILKDVRIDFGPSAAAEGMAYAAIIGPNGTGKTTILTWIGHALSTGWGRSHGSLTLDGRIWKFDGPNPSQGSPHVVARVQALNELRALATKVLFVRAVREPILQLQLPLQPGEPGSLPRGVAMNLNDDTSSARLALVHQWLMHLQLRGLKPKVWEAVEVLFPSLHFVEFNPADHDLIFDDRSHRVGFNALSAGQRAMITLLGEIERHCAPDGLVLWDEPEAHLHGSLQWELRNALAVVLPKGQVIVATHSPYILEGLAPNQVIVLSNVDEGT